MFWFHLNDILYFGDKCNKQIDAYIHVDVTRCKQNGSPEDAVNGDIEETVSTKGLNLML